MDSGDRFEDYTDNELMACTAAGYKKAYEILVLRYRREAQNYCNSLIKDPSWAEDIIQDSFADIYVRRKDYKDEFSFRTYLYAVIRHKAIDHLRKNGRLRFAEDRFPEALGMETESPEEKYLQKESKDQMAEWIRELPQNQREALYLFCVKGMSYGEIAGYMKKNTAQVKIWIYRARKKLQQRGGGKT